MIKTGKTIRALFFAFVLSFLGFHVNAQDVKVEASLSETNVFEGESVMFNISITGISLSTLDRPSPPEIPGLRYLPNRTFTNSNYSYANGRPSVTQSYGFQYIAQTTGSFTAPPVTITVDGKEYKTQPVTFKILDPKTVDQGTAERSPDIYVRLEPTTQKPVVGQQVVVDVVLYFKSEIEVSNYQTVPGWKAEGFWKEELENPAQARSTSTIINGIRYKRARLLQYALFPTKAGELTLSPYSISVRIRNNRRTARDPFSFSLGSESKELKSIPVTLDVERLPQLESAEYIGAVGDFEIKRSIKPDAAYVGESVEIITEISGSGNVPLLNKPDYEFPESLELYNPQESTNITRNNRRIAGNRTFTDIVIARNNGTYIIPEKRVATYNTEKGAYQYTTLPSLSFRADIDPNATVTSLEDMRLDISPVTGLASWTEATPTLPLSSRTYIWFMYFIPLLILGGAYGYKNYSDKINNDSGFARSTKAKKTAFSTLEEASLTDDVKGGYNLIQKSLSQFICDKLNLPEAGVSSQSLIESIRNIESETSVSTDLKTLLDKCETIAFAPNISPEGLESDIEKAKDLIKELGKVL